MHISPHVHTNFSDGSENIPTLRASHTSPSELKHYERRFSPAPLRFSPHRPRSDTP